MQSYIITYPHELASWARLPDDHFGMPLCGGCDRLVFEGYCPDCEEHDENYVGVKAAMQGEEL